LKQGHDNPLELFEVKDWQVQDHKAEQKNPVTQHHPSSHLAREQQTCNREQQNTNHCFRELNKSEENETRRANWVVIHPGHCDDLLPAGGSDDLHHKYEDGNSHQ
jgi:hypothetical protein